MWPPAAPRRAARPLGVGWSCSGSTAYVLGDVVTPAVVYFRGSSCEPVDGAEASGGATRIAARATCVPRSTVGRAVMSRRQLDTNILRRLALAVRWRGQLAAFGLFMRIERIALFLALTAVGCSSSGSKSTSSPSDAGGLADGLCGECLGPTPDAGAAASEDAGGDAGDGGPTVCNSLVNSAQPVAIVEVAGEPPPGEGGTPASGTYVLTSETRYTGPDGATGDGGTDQITIQIAGSTIQVSKTSMPTTATYSFNPSGTSYIALGICPPHTGGLMGSYTATPTTFTASLTAQGSDAGLFSFDTFTKQ